MNQCCAGSDDALVNFTLAMCCSACFDLHVLQNSVELRDISTPGCRSVVHFFTELLIAHLDKSVTIQTNYN